MTQAGSPGQIGSYVLVRELARGGMGVIHVARDERLGRQVALKLLLERNPDPDVERRFEREARALAALRHPGIVAVYELGRHDGRLFMAMELIEGESLADRLRREGPLPAREAAGLVEQVARALEHAHQAGVLHRDLKPANVLVDAGGQPRLVDFGLARADGASRSLTQTGEVLGTAAYMPPEQAGGERQAVGPRSDVYGLGATLYALLTGRPPFEGPSFVNVLKAVLVSRPPAPRSLRPELDGALEAICLRALEKEPEARQPTASALADDLAAYLAGSAQARPPSRPGRSAPRRAVGGALAAALVAAGALAVGLALANVPDERRTGSAPGDPAKPAQGAPAPPPRTAIEAPRTDVEIPTPESPVVTAPPAPVTRLRGRWQKVSSRGAVELQTPLPRFGIEGGLALAGRRGLLLHGGDNGTSELAVDTWTWSEGVWQVAGEGASPGGRRNHAMAYDPRLERVLLYGGAAGDRRLFAWDVAAGRWSVLDADERQRGPGPRDYAGLVHAPDRSSVLLFGGRSRNGELWEWRDDQGWRTLPGDPRLAGRYVFASSYDPERAVLRIFGGKGGQGPGDVLLEWRDGAFREPPRGDPWPLARTRAAMATGGRWTVLFGGRAGDEDQGDAWAWDGEAERWLQIDQEGDGPPGPREHHALVWDPRGCFVLFGGNRFESGRSSQLPIREDCLWELWLEEVP